MIWHIPAKTFLLGEYLALQQGPALVLTTKPCFTATLTQTPGLQGIHKDSPAGRFWQDQQNVHTQIPAASTAGLHWQDPYQGCGGLGASSAQFIAVYLAVCHIQQQKPSLEQLLNEYYQYSFSGLGLRPSGYDLIAQYTEGCVFIDKGRPQASNAWPFADLSYILLHTGVKLPTHEHLQNLVLPEQGLADLADIVYTAQDAWVRADSTTWVACVKAYQVQLAQRGWVAAHSLEQIRELSGLVDVLAMKGCGALGADVLLVLTSGVGRDGLLLRLGELGYSVLAMGWAKKNAT